MKCGYGAILKNAREKAGFTQTSLIESIKKYSKIDISKNMISHFEREITKPDLDILIQLSKYLDFEIKDLFEEEVFIIMRDLFADFKYCLYKDQLSPKHNKMLNNYLMLNLDDQTTVNSLIQSLAEKSDYVGWCVTLKLKKELREAFISDLSLNPDIQIISHGIPCGGKIFLLVSVDADSFGIKIKTKFKDELSIRQAINNIITGSNVKILSMSPWDKKNKELRNWEKEFQVYNNH